MFTSQSGLISKPVGALKDTEAEKDRILFSQLVITFYNSAWQGLGKIMDPTTGKVERNLEIARNSIDILDMLKRRTAGNLQPDEESFLDQALYQLRMNYVEELEADKRDQTETPTDERTAGETTDEPEAEEEKTPEPQPKPAAKKPQKSKSTKTGKKKKD